MFAKHSKFQNVQQTAAQQTPAGGDELGLDLVLSALSFSLFFGFFLFLFLLLRLFELLLFLLQPGLLCGQLRLLALDLLEFGLACRLPGQKLIGAFVVYGFIILRGEPGLADDFLADALLAGRHPGLGADNRRVLNDLGKGDWVTK